ncbi:MAG: hypothetical protein LBC98_02490, partial [Prevotellaceae bacterium]|nr:hypothetical protein [Prevotellaceae bacterium]
FGKLVFPIKLLYLYPFPIAPGKALPVHFFVYPVVIISAGIFLFKILKRQHWFVFFGLLFFIVNIVLMVHIVAMSRFCIIADRYVYLASVGLFFIAAWYGALWMRKKSVIIAVVCYLLYSGVYAHVRTYAWKNSDTLKKEFIELINDDSLKQKENSLKQEETP